MNSREKGGTISQQVIGTRVDAAKSKISVKCIFRRRRGEMALPLEKRIHTHTVGQKTFSDNLVICCG